MIFKIHATISAPSGTESPVMAQAVLEELLEAGWDVRTVLVERNSGGVLISEARATRSEVITNDARDTPGLRSTASVPVSSTISLG